MTAATPLRVEFPTPEWLNKRIFTIRDAASVANAKISTVNYWCDIATAHGYPLKVREDSRAFLAGHSVYVVAVLAALAKAGVSISVGVIAAVLSGTNGGLPGLGDVLLLSDGPAVIEVELSTVWIEVEPRLAAIAGDRA